MFESKAAEHTRPLFALANLLPLAFLVVTENEVILIDGCVGSGKPRNRSQFDHLDPSGFTEFTNTGFTPDDVSTVVLSHLHVDHVRWATQRGFVNLTERDWGSALVGYAGADSVGGKQVQAVEGTPVTSFHVANRPVISER